MTPEASPPSLDFMQGFDASVTLTSAPSGSVSAACASTASASVPFAPVLEAYVSACTEDVSVEDVPLAAAAGASRRRETSTALSPLVLRPRAERATYVTARVGWSDRMGR